MNKTIEQNLASLRHLSPAQLREKYLALFGESTRAGNKDFLVKRIAWRIQSLAEGGLSERAKHRASELARDADIRMTIPRSPQTVGAVDLVISTSSVSTGVGLPIPGTVLTRKYQGKLVEVSVLPKGFEYEGQVYRSLSAVAKLVTGSHWNGHLFFGLREKKNA